MVERVPQKRRFSKSTRTLTTAVIGGGVLFTAGHLVEQSQSSQISSLEASRDVVMSSIDSVMAASDAISPRIVIGRANGRPYTKHIQLADPSNAQEGLDAARATLADASSSKEKKKVTLRFQEADLVGQLTDVREATTHVDPSDLDSTNKLLSDLSSIISELELDRGRYDEQRVRHLLIKGTSAFFKWSGIVSIVAAVGYVGLKDSQVLRRIKSSHTKQDPRRDLPVE